MGNEDGIQKNPLWCYESKAGTWNRTQISRVLGRKVMRKSSRLGRFRAVYDEKLEVGENPSCAIMKRLEVGEIPSRV